MPDETDTKVIYESKTAVVNLIILVSAFFPPVQAWVTAHPTETLEIVGVAGLILRLITKDKIVLFKS